MKINIRGIGGIEVQGSPDNPLELGGGRKIPHAKRLGDVSNNCMALKRLLEGLNVPSLNVVDYFAGLGIWAAVVSSFNPKSLVLWELDFACIQHLRRSFNCVVHRGNSFNEIGRSDCDLALLDLTKWTWLNMRTSGWFSCIVARGTSIIVSDCAGAKLHINYRAYGLSSSATYAEYLKQYNVWLNKSGYGLRSVVYCNGKQRPRSAYLLMSPSLGVKDYLVEYLADPTALTIE